MIRPTNHYCSIIFETEHINFALLWLSIFLETEKKLKLGKKKQATLSSLTRIFVFNKKGQFNMEYHHPELQEQLMYVF
jgi:hypothetical protein